MRYVFTALVGFALAFVGLTAMNWSLSPPPQVECSMAIIDGSGPPGTIAYADYIDTSNFVRQDYPTSSMSAQINATHPGAVPMARLVNSDGHPGHHRCP